MLFFLKSQAIFEIEFFKKNPKPFYTLSEGILDAEGVNPVGTHHFIKKVCDEGLLLHCFTQNIDGLELDAGLPMD